MVSEKLLHESNNQCAFKNILHYKIEA